MLISCLEFHWTGRPGQGSQRRGPGLPGWPLLRNHHSSTGQTLQAETQQGGSRELFSHSLLVCLFLAFHFDHELFHPRIFASTCPKRQSVKYKWKPISNVNGVSKAPLHCCRISFHSRFSSLGVSLYSILVLIIQKLLSALLHRGEHWTMSLKCWRKRNRDVVS